MELQSRPRIYRRDQLPPHRHPQPYNDDITYHNRDREILEAVVENPGILELLEKSKQSYMNPHNDYNSVQYPRSMSRPYMNVNLEPLSVYDYPKLKVIKTITIIEILIRIYSEKWKYLNFSYFNKIMLKSLELPLRANKCQFYINKKRFM